jgi:phasin family protein
MNQHRDRPSSSFIKLEMSRNAAPPRQVLRAPATESTGFLTSVEDEMVDQRQENKLTKKTEEAFRETGEQAAEQTRRIGLAAASAGEDMSQVSADFLRQNAEIMQNAWRFGMEAVSVLMSRSTDQFGRTFGWRGDEAKQATDRSVQNTQTVLNSATAVSKGVNEISREYFQFARRQMETNIDRMNELWNCRTPHELAALQSEFVRDTVASALESSRRVADMSLKVADDAGKRIADNMQRAA